MDDISFVIQNVQNSLNEKAMLLHQASVLDNQARLLREQASTNNLNVDIENIQNEVIGLIDRMDLLNSFISLACKKFASDDEQILISLFDYQNGSFQGRSIEMIEKELIYISNRIIFLMGILRQLCDFVGHDFRYIKSEAILDFGDLEASFEEKQINYCAICGESLYLDVDDKKCPDYSKIEFLEKLRKAHKMSVYKSKFKIVDKLQR